jgi:hypothetical protein
MRELPILFSTPMVQAIQEHLKVMTRRTSGLEKVNENPDEFKIMNLFYMPDGTTGMVQFDNKGLGFVYCKPRYQVGDKLWVKETFTIIPPNFIVYKAETESPEKCKWKSSLFMRKEYARLWLEVTEVRCERLQLISHSDALNEGIKFISDADFTKHYDYVEKEFTLRYPSHSFFSLWRSINGKDSVAANPWVFVYRFKRIPKP